jgi:hypothetical protein
MILIRLSMLVAGSIQSIGFSTYSFTGSGCVGGAVRACVEPDGAVEVSKVDIVVGDTGAVDDDSSVRT